MPYEYPDKKSENEVWRLARECQETGSPILCGAHGLLIHDDNFTAMSRLLPTYREKIDLIYIDPPYNTNENYYYSQERVSHVSPTASAKIAYSDKFSQFEYLEFIRARLILIHALLSPIGTLYLHIDIKNAAYIKIILDEIFGQENFLNQISRIKSNPKNFARRAYGNQQDVILVYSKTAQQNIFNDIRIPLSEEEIIQKFPKRDPFGRSYTTVPCHAPGETKNGPTGSPWRGLLPPAGRHWRAAPCELENLDKQGLIEWSRNGVPRIIKLAADHAGKKMQDIWTDYKDPPYPSYPTEKNANMLKMIILQSSNSGSLILDCFCGSGAFLAAGMTAGRKPIGIDASATAIKVAKKRTELKMLEVWTPANLA